MSGWGMSPEFKQKSFNLNNFKLTNDNNESQLPQNKHSPIKPIPMRINKSKTNA